MKLVVWKRIYLRLGWSGVRIDAPAMLAKYAGTSGKIQGDKKDEIPKPRAAKKRIIRRFR